MFIPVPLPSEMAQWDLEAMKTGLLGEVLMENAARAATAFLRRMTGGLRGKHVLFVAGGGNNGGDAFCMARHMLEEGALPLLVHTKEIDAYKGAAAHWLQTALRLEIPHCSASDWLIGRIPQDFEYPDLAVDALLGTGFHGTLRPMEQKLVESLNSLICPIFSVDVPSGLNAESGLPSPIAVRAAATATFHAPKVGLLRPGAEEFTGILEVLPIGIPILAQKPSASFRTWLCPWQITADNTWRVARCADDLKEDTNEDFHNALLKTLPTHKGEAGRVLIVGGCRIYPGAPSLAALGALRGGAGLVSVAAPEEALSVARALNPAFISHPIQEWTESEAQALLDGKIKFHSCVLGPGMGRSLGAEEAVRTIFHHSQRPPCVLDADGLSALAAQPELWGLLNNGDILTPHPGEAARFLSCSAADVQNDRFGALTELSQKIRAVWILKGEGTLISVPDTASVVSPWRVPQLSVAGSGDVLAGLAGALLAQGFSAEKAAVFAVWSHATAGMLLAKRFPLRGNGPLEIAENLPPAIALTLGMKSEKF